MDDKMQKIFSHIQAEQELKERTKIFIHNELQMRSKRQQIRQKTRWITICASFAIFFVVCGFSYNLYYTPISYVDVDVNPSIELTLNRFARIIDVSSHNDDGAEILETIAINNIRYNDALQNLIDAMIAQGYLQQNGLVSVTVQSNDKFQENDVIAGIEKTVATSLQAYQVKAETDIFPVTQEIKVHAHAKHVSPAKYLAITELQEIDPSTTFEHCSRHTLSEIKQLTKEKHGRHHMRNSADESKISNGTVFDETPNNDNRESLHKDPIEKTPKAKHRSQCK